jgi:hypothetical protein
MTDNSKNTKAEDLMQDDSVHKIPLSHVIHVDIDDEVSAIFERIKTKKTDLIYMIVPNRAVLLQSIVNLKILKRKAKDEGKELALITKDKSGIFFANKCNILVYDQISENKKEVTTADVKEPILTEADRNKSEFTTSKPVKSDKKRTSIAEVVKRVSYQNYIEKSKKFFYKLSRKQGRKQYTKKLLMSNPNRTLLVSLTTASLILLGLITYVALPNATVYVKANSVPIEQATNITFADANKNAGLLRTRPNKVIASYEISPGILESIINYKATGVDLTSANSNGTITIYNKVDRDLALVAYTRVATDDGMIFRTQQYVAIPRGSAEAPSQVYVDVVADPVDSNNVQIGERGNIAANTNFTIPGITQISSEDIYAINPEPFTGGVTSKDRIVTAEDVQAAREFARTELIRQVPQKLQEYLTKYNAERNLSLALLNDSQVIKIGEVQVTLDESIIGQKMTDFVVTARVEASGIGYDHKEFLSILKEEISVRKSPDKSLTKIDETGVTSRILKINPEVGIVELTATIRGVEQFNISTENEAGQKVVKKIADHIAGNEVKEAKQFIESLPEVESADITTWPFWAPTIPSRPESIKILIDDRK